MQPKHAKQFRTFPCQAHKLVSELEAVLDREIPRDRYLLDSILSKYCGPSTTPADVRMQNAFKKLHASEKRNKRTNDRLTTRLDHRFGGHLHGVSFDAVLGVARKLIADCIGPFSFGIYEYAAFTSGAGVGYPRNRSDVWYKYKGRITCTLNAFPRVVALVKATPAWHSWLCSRYGDNPRKWVKIVAGNVSFTVQKEEDCDRAAAKEPTGNVLLQTSVGYHIRRSLRKVGIDLNDQSRNRNAAWYASITGSDATLDMRDASNSLVSMLVRLLLDPDWYRACVAARSPKGSIDGSPHTWEMFSSMGNGFTFELETLIFWALSEAVRVILRCPGRTLVYGDDIVVPTAAAHGVIAVLGFAGFQCNTKKTFIKGPFRESCGGHYLQGLDVTPVYIRKPITDTSRMIWFLNALRKWSGDTGICDPRVSDLYFRYRRKYVDDVLWGGNRLSSISSLATPHGPRQRLRFLTEGKEIDGIAAVLRTFQAANRGENPDDSWGADLDPQCYYEMYGTVPITANMSKILTVSGLVLIHKNPEQADPAGIPLFPRELELGR